MPTTAVVLLNYNGEELLKKYLPIILEYTPKELGSIYVLDNASNDNSKAVCTSISSRINFVELDKNYGYAKGYNIGLKAIQADVYVLLNTDVQVTPNWLRPVLAQLENEDVAVAMPKILDAGAPNYFEHAGAAGGFIDAFGFPFCRGRVFETVEEDNGQYNNAIECHWASGAAFFVKETLFWEAGGFDERFFMHMEEIDLCWRLQNQGYKIICEPKSTVYHVGGGSLAYENPRKIYLNFRNNLWMCWGNWGNVERLWKLPIRLLLDGLAAWRLLLKGNAAGFLAIFKAHIAFVFSFFQLKPKLRQQQGKKAKGIWNGLLPYSYFIKGKKTYEEIL